MTYDLFLKKTDKSISAITFSCDDTATLIKNNSPNKAHGYDISIRMLKYTTNLFVNHLI